MKNKRFCAMLMAICMVASSVLAGLTWDENLLSVQAATETPTIPFEMNFEEMTVGEEPEGWTVHSNGWGTASMKVASDNSDSSNNVVTLKQAEKNAKNFIIQYFFDAVDDAVLEYRFKTDETTGNFSYLPRITYNGGVDAPLVLYVNGPNKQIQYTNQWGGALKKAADFVPGKWHTVKIALNLTQGVRQLWIDETEIALDASFMNQKPLNSTKKLDSIGLGFDANASNGDFHIDDLKVSAYRAPITMDFEEMTVGEEPEGWTVHSNGWGTASMKVASDNSDSSNNVVTLKQAEKNAKNFIIQYFFDAVDDAVLEYRFKTDETTGNFSYLPRITYNGGVDAPLVLYVNGPNKQIQYTNQWGGALKKAADFVPGKWHTVKIALNLTQGVRQLWIDETEIALDASFMNQKPLNSTKKLDSIGLGFDANASNGDFHIDDVKVTAHNYVMGTDVTFAETDVRIQKNESITLKPIFTPADTSDQGMTYTTSDAAVATVDANGMVTGIGVGEATITAKPSLSSLEPVTIKVTVWEEEAITIPFTVDFENQVANTTPKGWLLRPSSNKEEDNAKSSMTVVSDGDNTANDVAMVKQTAVRTSNYYMQYYFEEADKAVLEYRFKTVSGTNYTWLPTIAYKGSVDAPLNLMINGSNLQYSGVRDKWVTAVNNLKADTWYTVKMVVDLKNDLRELWVDGEQILLDKANMEKYPCSDTKTLDNVTLGIYSATASSTFYIDDMSMELYVVGENVTFEQTNLTLPVNGSITLKPTFVPASTSVQGMSYTSSDESVATVDSNGVVFGLKEGTAVITADPSLPTLQNVEINVTVSGELQGSITVDKDTLSLPVGGHEFLKANLEFNLTGIVADNTMKYVSSNPEVATVDEWGEVLAVGTGSTTITISSVANPNIKSQATVTVTASNDMKTIYVAPNGTGDGETAQTPTTLQGAVAKLAAIDKNAMTGNVEIILADGYYYQNETLKLSEAHGGNNLYSVIFKAAEDAQPVIGGGIKIAGADFEETTTEGLYVYDLSKQGIGTIETRQMFVDNVRATRARSKGTLTNAEYLLDEDGKKIGYVCDDKDLLNFARIQDLELVSYNSWIHQRGQAVSVNETTDGRVEIIMEQPGFDVLTRSVDYMSMLPNTIEYYENALELLDEAGEWYLDEGAQKLYYMPRAWEVMDDVTVTLPIMDDWDEDDDGHSGLITIMGSDVDNQVQNICFEGITFADTTWTRPSSKYGHAPNQNNYLRDTTSDSELGNQLVDAAITVRLANSVNFQNCTFTRLGINAINMYDGVQNSLIQGSHFYDISGNALAIGESNYTADVDNYDPADIRNMMKNVDVLNNYIHDIGVDYMSSSAISVGFAANVDMCHNEIFNVPYSGFHIGYGWNKVFYNVTRNMNISENFIHDYLLDGMYDGGAVYTNGPTGGDEDSWNIFSRNYTRNQGEKVAPLYADQGTSWWKFIDNVVDTSTVEVGERSGFTIHWGYVNMGLSDILMSGNYTTTLRSNGASASQNIVIENNTQVENLNWPQEAVEIINASGLESSYSSLRNGQAERIVTAIPEEGMELKVDDTFDISLRATDGKDREVSLDNAIVSYEILNEEIATVDENGIITGKADGQTVVRMWVVSNGILDVIERDLYVGDEEIEALYLKDRDNIVLFEDAKDQYLSAYGVTVTGREVEFDEVTWTVEDTNVAVVDENGCLKPVAVGTTSLTVKGTKGKYSKSASFEVIINKSLNAEVHYLDEIFEQENKDQWVFKSNDPYYWDYIDGTQISAQLNKWATYTGRTYQNELLTFKMSLEDASGWPSIVLRAQSADKAVALGETGYIICMGDKGLQVQRFNGSTRTPFYGNISAGEGGPGILGASDIPHPLSDNEMHEIQIGALNEEDGVRLVMFIDGKEYFNFVDNYEGAITEPGYLGLIGYSKDIFVLEKMSDPDGETEGYTAGLSSLTSEVTIGETVNVNVAVDHSDDEVFAAGEVVLTYDSEKLTFNKDKSELNGATVTEDPAGTLTLEDYGKDKDFGNAVYVLAFDAKADGEAAVEITSAAFVNKEEAVKSDLIAATISPAGITLTVNKTKHNVTLPEGFTGDATVTDGDAYTFSVSEDGAYFEYGEVTATVNGTPVDVTKNPDGTYTIDEVTGVLVISGTRTAKSFDVTIEGTGADEIEDAAEKATYGTDYTFTMPTADGFAYKLESLKIGGVDVTGESVYEVDPDTNQCTIVGSAIKGVIVMNISKTATKAGVTVNGTGASAAAGYSQVATIGADYTLTIVPESGWTYVVTATMNGETAVVIDDEDNTYTIEDVTGPIVFTVERILKVDGIEVTDYLTIDGSNIWLVKNTVTVNEGKVPTYDGNNMFWSDKYQAYCYLVIKETFTAEDLTGKVNIADGTAVTVDYDMDVNKSGKVDASDAQLTYNIYNAMYEEFTQDVTVEKFLRADVNGDTKVNVEDAAAIITYILKQ